MNSAPQSIAEQVDGVRSGRQSARTNAALTRRRIEAAEPRVRAWVALSSDIERQAKSVDENPSALPLAGVSVGVKDIIDVTGLPTRAGTSLTSARPVTSDATIVARLKELGGVIQGKTVTTEFAYLQPGPTHNPHAPNHTPGGSSSGSAAAVGAGTVPLALGSQTAGSLTRPAAYCGAAGLVLPPGSVDMTGIVGLSPTLDSLGLLTRTVEDLRQVYDAVTNGIPPTDRRPTTRLRTWDGDALADLAPEMAALTTSLAGLATELSYPTSELGFTDHVRRLTDEHLEVMAFEARQMRRHEYPTHAAQLSTPLKELLAAGDNVTADRHAAVLRYRDQAFGALVDHLGEDSLIVGPATPGPAPSGLSSTGTSVFSRAWQLLGLPVVVVPGARTPGGLPLGLQIIGLPGDEGKMLQVGVQLERALRDRHETRPEAMPQQ